MVGQVHPLKGLQPMDNPRNSDFLLGMQPVKDLENRKRWEERNNREKLLHMNPDLCCMLAY